MGLGLSLKTVFEVARITVPTFAEAVTGRLEREVADQRLRDFARRVLDHARVDLEVYGRERVPHDRAFVYMSNHQSHMDIPILYRSLPAQTLRMVAKTELFRIPIWGPTMRAGGMIEVDRKNRDKAIESLRRAGDAIADGVNIWIAPEGSRSRDGRLGKLKKGGFHLARDTGTEIVPVSISGSYNILPAGTRDMRYDIPVRVDIGEPIPTQDRSIDELVDAVRDYLEEHVATTGRHAPRP